MATVVEVVERDGHEIAIYESGAEYDRTTHRLVKASPQGQFNQERSLAAVQRRAELKREAIARGAAKILERSGEWEAPNDIDVAEAMAEAVMLKALNPDNPKQVDAARFILQEMAMAENQTSSNVNPSNFSPTSSDFASFARSIAQIVSDVLQAKAAEPLRETIDGKIND